MQPKPLILMILDGWGYREEKQANAIAQADTPVWDDYWKRAPHGLLDASGLAVGLPAGQMGNSEVGHLTMGSGRVVYQDLTRIDQAIEDGNFYKNEILCTHLKRAQTKSVHVLGLLSEGGVHSHLRHFQALLRLASEQGVHRLYVHAFLDGRDCPPRSASSAIRQLEKDMKRLHCGRIVSIIGRYYAMDRDQRWERIAAAYELLTQNKAVYHAFSAEEGLKLAYARGETDEFVQATSIHTFEQTPVAIESGDLVIFMNFRADRARQLTHAFLDKNFNGFDRQVCPELSGFISLTQYAVDLPTQIAFPPQSLTNQFGQYIAQNGLTQLRIAETEKYAHVTFFFNGGVEQRFTGEDRTLIDSQRVATYDLKPQMSALQITEALIGFIKQKKYDVIICNFANPDMVGHTGHMPQTITAIETIDQCLKQIIKALEEVNGEILITADHGNAEYMFDEQTQQPHTAHTSEPVPFIYIGRPAKTIRPRGTLADIAPTLLYLLGLPQPKEMTGACLIELIHEETKDEAN